MSCLFCDRNFIDENVVEEDDYCYAIYDNYAVTEGHALIIPKEHVNDFLSLRSDKRTRLIGMVNKMKKRIDEMFEPDGYNIGINMGQAAGQTVPHLHIHLIPRYEGDMEDPRGGVRGVIPEKQKY